MQDKAIIPSYFFKFVEPADSKRFVIRMLTSLNKKETTNDKKFHSILFFVIYITSERCRNPLK